MAGVDFHHVIRRVVWSAAEARGDVIRISLAHEFNVRSLSNHFIVHNLHIHPTFFHLDIAKDRDVCVMPASLRVHGSRGTSSSRPYDRRSPATSPAQSEDPLVHPHLPRSLPPASPIQDTNTDPNSPPDHPGLPTYAEYKRIEAQYLQSLSPRKRDKALVTQAMFDKIWDVLHQPEACAIETPQFRFWVRKMFSLSRPMCAEDGGWGGRHVGWGTGMGMYPDMALDSDTEETDLELERAMGIDADASAELFSAVVLHENRPVAIMEQLYELFCYCHVRAGHGGRDKTCAVIRQHYSWVPKELTAQFVKACPTCALKRSGHGGVGVGVDMSWLGRRRVGGHRERRAKGMSFGAGEMAPSSLGGMGWPTTGGPLDPANPEPCGVPEQERAWLRAREDVGTIDRSNLPVSPACTSFDVNASDSRTQSVPSQVPFESCLPSGWNGVPRASTADASPFHLCDATNRSIVGTTGFPGPIAVHENNRAQTRSKRGGKRSLTRTGLPPLASALSNERLDENANMAGLGPQTADECLPPALRPLRLLGPIPSDTESDLILTSPESYLFQIDPVLLSFNYPGIMGLSETGSASSGGESAMPLSLDLSGALGAGSQRHLGRGQPDAILQGQGDVVTRNVASPGLCRLPGRRRSSDCIDIDMASFKNTTSRTLGLGPSDDDDGAPELGFEHGAAPSVYCTTLARSTTRSSRTRRRGSRFHDGRRDGSLALLYPCSADEVGQELDGALSCSIMTDA